ncbi:hypothetical protein VHUM_02317 [Vanrija humicola]|uniref:Uncharacterized protein n=1 Tax=Vanrija humicola TaxID=5417 RepID=A0A7D8UZZ0_VANHU|nr:hypothetical protein VHUM_02317 [Vanrija humicola]
MALSSVALPDGNSGGLGYLDPTAEELELTIELVPPASSGEVKARGRGKKKPAAAKAVSIDLAVIQDPGALRARVGDTGSVLWRSSLHLARHVLQQHHFPPAAPDAPLLDKAALGAARVLELGAGTGVLASLLAPLCASYTATDRKENLKLVRRNVEANAKDGAADAAELDWLDVARARKKDGYESPLAAQTDLVVAVDCIYNESLVGPLVDTLAALCAKGAVAWVVVELRSSDVVSGCGRRPRLRWCWQSSLGARKASTTMALRHDIPRRLLSLTHPADTLPRHMAQRPRRVDDRAARRRRDGLVEWRRPTLGGLGRVDHGSSGRVRGSARGVDVLLACAYICTLGLWGGAGAGV